MIARHLATLRLVPAQPSSITAGEIAAHLASLGHRVTPRTVQRDLVALATIAPIVAVTAVKPFAWAWLDGASCPCCGGGR